MKNNSFYEEKVSQGVVVVEVCWRKNMILDFEGTIKRFIIYKKKLNNLVYR